MFQCCSLETSHPLLLPQSLNWCTFVWIPRGRSIYALWFPVKIRITLCKCPLNCCYCCLVSKSRLTPVIPRAIARPPGSSVHEIFQARILESIAVSSSRGSSRPGDRTWISCSGRQILYHWATKEELSPHTQHSFVNQVQFSSVAQSCPTLFDPMNHSMPGLPVHHQLLESTQTHVHCVMPSNHLILCCPLLLLPSIFPSNRVFSSESALRIRWPKYWNFSFNISPSNEYPGLVSFRMDWLVLLAVQGTLESLLQHHSSKASILWCSAFFIVQLSHPYMTTGKTIALLIK